MLANDTYKGQGYGTEALRLALRHAFETLGLRTVYADTMGSNAAMRRIMEKLGFQFLGADPRYYDMRGRWEDRLNYRLENPNPCAFYASGALRQPVFSVIFARYRGQWLFCRHRRRVTWETPGGHIEAGETPLAAAQRELFEETGAQRFTLTPLFDYRVIGGPPEAGGSVFFARVDELGPLPPFEMARVAAFDALPGNLTYPTILPAMYARALLVLGDPDRPATDLPENNA